MNIQYNKSKYIIVLSKSAVSAFEEKMQINQMDGNKERFAIFSKLYSDINVQLSYISRGNFDDSIYISDGIWKCYICDSGAYFTYSILIDDNNQNEIVVHDFFFPMPLAGIYSILKEKRTIKVTEKQLRNIIKESIKRVLNII